MINLCKSCKNFKTRKYNFDWTLRKKEKHIPWTHLVHCGISPGTDREVKECPYYKP